MTLLERALLNGFGSSTLAPSTLSLGELRKEIEGHISMGAIAELMTLDPERAKSELRAACRHVFANDKWIDLDSEYKAKIVADLLDVVFGMGPLDRLMQDPTITEIMVNGAENIFFEKNGKLEKSPYKFENDDQVRVLIDRIIGPLGRRIDESSPMVNARLPEGHRINAILPPLAPDGPHITLRLFPENTLTMKEMVATGSIEDSLYEFLQWCVLARLNLAVLGGTGSGKTTLLNSLSCHIPIDERVITIEDSAELRFKTHPHVVRLEARPKNAEGSGEITIRDLVINALRMRPDRIIVGECRGGEALDMLQAMNTGHQGSLTTLHANSPHEAIDRLTTMVRYVVDLPVDAIYAQIGNAFDLLIQTVRGHKGDRYIQQVMSVSFDYKTRSCLIDPLYRRDSFESIGTWTNPDGMANYFIEKGISSNQEVERWLSRLSMQ